MSATRAHAAFALRPAGQQVLANVGRVLDLARRYEAGGGRSFRGFVETLDREAERRNASESPLIEPEAEGVRLMTVHTAKGLEFPIVLLADMTAKLTARQPARTIDNRNQTAVQRLLGLTPIELLENRDIELARERAEGLRVAYVAATRARDMLVVPAVGDVLRPGWVEPLNHAVYPPKGSWRDGRSAEHLGCPPFGEASVLARPQEYDGRAEESVRPGLYRLSGDRQHDADEAPSWDVVWWDPAALAQVPPPDYGLRQESLLVEDDEGIAASGVCAFEQWQSELARARATGVTPSHRIEVVTELDDEPPGPPVIEIVRVDLPDGSSQGVRAAGGKAFGSLVHAVLADIDLASDQATVIQATRLRARLLGASEDDVELAADAVRRALAHALLEAARQAKEMRREVPFHHYLDEHRLLEGTIDLCYRDESGWTVVDFKTDRDPVASEERTLTYRRQLGWYVYALERMTGEQVRGVLLYV